MARGIAAARGGVLANDCQRRRPLKRKLNRKGGAVCPFPGWLPARRPGAKRNESHACAQARHLAGRCPGRAPEFDCGSRSILFT